MSSTENGNDTDEVSPKIIEPGEGSSEGEGGSESPGDTLDDAEVAEPNEPG